MIVDLAYVKTHAGLGSATTYDATLTEIIRSVGHLFDAEVGYTLESSSTEFYASGDGLFTKLIVPYGPIIAISTLTESGTTLTSGAGNFRSAGRVVTRLSGGYPVAWAAGVDNIHVTYTHGYVCDVTSGSFNLPRDIRLAAVEEIRRRFKMTNAGGERIDLSSKVTGREGGDANYVGGELLPTTRETLRLHREVY